MQVLDIPSILGELVFTARKGTQGIYLKSTGELIQDLRIKAGYTQRTLADILHITDKAISKWERGICLPDISLLPKLSLLLDADLELLLSRSVEQEQWIGLIDIYDCDFSQIVYDKPLINYLLVHYLLLGVTNIHFLTNKENKAYLENQQFRRLGFQFFFSRPESSNTMILNKPWFIFGSDLTQQFQGAMLSQRMTRLVPENQPAVSFFAPAQTLPLYFADKKQFYKKASARTLGRGMVCLDMSKETILDVAAFVKTYQSNSGLLIGSLEEVAYKKGFITKEQLLDLSSVLPYGEAIKHCVNHKSIELAGD